MLRKGKDREGRVRAGGVRGGGKEGRNERKEGKKERKRRERRSGGWWREGERKRGRRRKGRGVEELERWAGKGRGGKQEGGKEERIILLEMFRHLVQGDDSSADATKAFYDEYRAVCDMTAEFYLQTIDVVFQRHALPKGEMMHRDTRVDPAAITDRAAGHRGRARRYFGDRPDQGRPDSRDRAAQGREEVFPRPRRGSLRHIQRQQMAQHDRAGCRRVDRLAQQLKRRSVRLTG